ncbi:unnamed protein product [Haemonchus placei]|uniref:WD_REPEATS_REGION domain-containing protein n=1 Tax=Haemonchus placei TaxID=6290 RepID=A0A0N4X292_HAEPC|nr:unnamed protein product [Haemonchus placei]
MGDRSEEFQSSGDTRHVQVSFFSEEQTYVFDIQMSVVVSCSYETFLRISNSLSAIFDVPVSATCENLNTLVNKTISSSKDDWNEQRFEFLVGETFIRTSLAEFIEEYDVETETVIKIECVLGKPIPKPLHDIPAPDWVSSVIVSPSHFFSTTYSGEIIIMDKKGKKVLENSREKGSAYKCSVLLTNNTGIARNSSFTLYNLDNSKKLEGTQLVTAGENQMLTLFEVEDGTLLPRTVFRGHERSVECVDANVDCTRLVSGDESTVFEKDARSENKPKKRKENFITKVPMVTLGGHKDAVVGLKWCPYNESHVISASWDHSIAVWDLQLAGEVSRIRGLKAFTSIDVNQKSGLVISSNTDAVPRLYDPRSHDGSLVKQSFVGHTGWVSCVRWNPCDERCFVSSSFDKSVKMWDIRSSKTSLFDLHGHDDRVLCCAWGQNGLIASGSADATVKIFSTT